MIKKEIAEIDQRLRDIVNSVKIVGDLDQDGYLIIGEREALPEAVERQKKMDVLRAKRRNLECLINKKGLL